MKASEAELTRIVRRQLSFGFVGLLLFVLLGIVLEFFHAFKWLGYLHAEHESRRFLLRLAHAHGTLLSVVQLVFALAGRAHPVLLSSIRPAAITLAQWLIPAGFLLGAWGAHDGDPGPLIAFLPAGAGCLVVGLSSTALALRSDAHDWEQKISPTDDGSGSGG